MPRRDIPRWKQGWAYLGLLGAILFFLLIAVGPVVLGPEFDGSSLYAPAWALLFIPLYLVLGPAAMKLLISLLQPLFAGAAAALAAAALAAAAKQPDDQEKPDDE